MSALRVFVLEDDDNLRHLLCETLNDEDYQVDSASHGREALEKVSNGNFDLLVIDVRMEGISGLDAFEMMRHQGVEIASLVITGYATEEDSVRAIRLGVGDYLRKPFQMHQFLSCVRRLTARFQRQRDQAERERHLGDLLEALLGGTDRDWTDLARSQGLQRWEWLGLTLAARQPDKLPPQFAHWLEAAQETWDGGGPRGWSGDHIPLHGRLLRLALPGSQGLDPYLRASLGCSNDRQRRLLTSARVLLQSGDREGAAEALRQLPPAGRDGIGLQQRLLQLRLLHPSEQLRQAQENLQECDDGDAYALHGVALRHCPQARVWLERGRREARSEAFRAQAELALWVGGHGHEFEQALTTLAQPWNEPALVESLPWLWGKLVELWQDRPEHPSSRWLRHYNSNLLAGWHELSQAQQNWLLAYLRQQKWASPLLGHLHEPRSAPLLRVRCFGAAEISVGGEIISDRALRGVRNRFLIIYLACSARPVSEDRLIDVFWPEDYERGKRGLYNSVSLLRRVLRPTGWNGPIDYIQRQRDQIQLHPECERWCDSEELQRTLDAAGRQREAGNLPELRRLLLKASRLYQGPFLEECFLDWAIEERRRWEREMQAALLLSIELEEAAGEFGMALHQAHKALGLDPCSQPALAAAMRCLLRLGRPEEAIRHYQFSARKLREELDLEPSLELFELYQRARL